MASFGFILCFSLAIVKVNCGFFGLVMVVLKFKVTLKTVDIGFATSNIVFNLLTYPLHLIRISFAN